MNAPTSLTLGPTESGWPLFSLVDDVRPALRDTVGAVGGVMGMVEVDTIPLVDGPQGVTRVKVTIGKSTYYFIIDSGASDIMVSDQLEREMEKDGTILGAARS